MRAEESRRAGISWLVVARRLDGPHEKSEIIGETRGKRATTKHAKYTKDGVGRTMGAERWTSGDELGESRCAGMSPLVAPRWSEK